MEGIHAEVKKKMAFERFTGLAPRAEEPRVSIRLKGKLGFNSAAIRQYKVLEYTYIILYYDKSLKTVGIEMTNDADAPGALYLCKPKICDAYVCAQSFFVHFKIPFTQTRRAVLKRKKDKKDFFTFEVPPQKKLAEKVT